MFGCSILKRKKSYSVSFKLMSVEVAQNNTKEAGKIRIVANISIGNHDNN